ncbi:hypothetical protein F0U44_08905 [Nocardioides humilatus]|uniref:Uncharacterized protein n=1 Tax=Nocardioides humilatus TaxID=2607660 RepID=A0A5B1LEH3_9ACTN|nr:hypothetical protein [Nocardioides humilatus]KAA1418608.1 hypothetical protein F0U44_08905 [Nocardioides humilatus]
MTAVWAAVVLAAVAVSLYAAYVSRTVVSATWPEEAPLHLRENRAHDQQINHLERLLAADDPTAAHAVVREVTAHLLAMPVLAETRLDPAAAAFVVDPPLGSAERYRRDLATALRRIEDL